MGDQSKLAIGSTPNLAARLQGVASTDEIVIASSTRRLIGNAFELVDLGEQEQPCQARTFFRSRSRNLT